MLSIAASPTLPLFLDHERKRTSSFSSLRPHPPKAAKTSSLQRTHSVLDLSRSLSDLSSMELYGRAGPPRPAVSEPHPRVLKRQQQQQQPQPRFPRTSHDLDFQSFVASTARVPIPTVPTSRVLTPAPLSPPASSSSRGRPPSPTKPKATAAAAAAAKRDSPRRFLPPRERYPRAQPSPNLYRQAIVARMQASPAGAQILQMGARAAVAMLEATRALERLVAESGMDVDDDDDDVDEDELRLDESWLDLCSTEECEMAA